MEKLKTAGKLLTIRQDWNNTRRDFRDAQDEARDLLEKNAWDEKKLRRENNEERGKTCPVSGLPASRRLRTTTLCFTTT